MLSINSNKKKRRFSQEEISNQYINFSPHESFRLEAAQKFKKLECKSPNARNSVEVLREQKTDIKNDVRKRTTDWSKNQVDTIEFQKIIEKRKQKTRFKFKTIDIKSIPFRNHNSVSDPYQFERIKSVVDYQFKPEKKLSLEKQSLQFCLMQKELKDLNDKQVEQKARNKVLGQLVSILSQDTLKFEQDQMNERSVSVREQYSKLIRKEQHKMDFFIKLTNDIKQKIIFSKKEIFAYRSQRVVYSSIFKELEREIKLAQNCYNRILINSMAFFETFYFSSLNTNNQRQSSEGDKQTENNQNPLSDYNKKFSNIFRSNGVKFTGTLSNYEEEMLNDRINSSTAINYYMKERKIMILPRYKQHYQSSRIKLKIQTQNLSYETLANQINRFLQALNLQHKIEITPIDPLAEHKKTEKPITSTMLSKSNFQINHSPKFHHSKINSFAQANTTNSRTSANFQIFTENQVEKVKKLIDQIPAQNEDLLKEIQKLDHRISQASDEVKIQKQKVKLQKTSPLTVSSFPSQINSDSHNDETFCKNQLEIIQDLLGVQGQEIFQKRIFFALKRLQQFQILTKTDRLFENIPNPFLNPSPPEVENVSRKPSESDQLNSERSNVSINLKRTEKKLPSPQKVIKPTQKQIRKTQNDLLCRSPQNLNSILRNIHVYDSYQRAFQRMDFQKQYEAQKNKKKRTLIRRDGMVSLCLLKNQQKNRIIRKSSNKKYLQNQK